MIGVTNAQKDEFKHSHDPHTLLLLTDSPVDRSMYCQNLTISGAVFSSGTQQHDNRNSMYFNGSSYLILHKLDYTLYNTEWTIEQWSYVTATRGTAFYHQAISNNGQYGLLLGYSGTADSNFYLSSNNSSWNLSGSTTYTNATLNTWNHRAIVRHGNDFLFFTNGSLYLTKTISGSYTLGATPFIGYYYGGDKYIGYMQDYRISDIARYTSNFTPPTRFL